MDYLLRDRSTLSAPCITYAMFQIAYAGDRKDFDRHPEAIRVLVAYLDYRLPDASKLSAAIARNHDEYPADEALYAIGKPAVPELISAIASPATADVARFNAAWVMFLIYGNDRPEAIRVLKRAASAASDFSEAERLRAAAGKVEEICSKGTNAAGCREALYEKD